MNESQSITPKTAIVVAIITVLGGIFIALINKKWGGDDSKTVIEAHDNSIKKNTDSQAVANVLYPQKISFCDVVMKLCQDAQNDFSNIRFKRIALDKDSESWNIKYQYLDLPITIEYDIDEGSSEAEILVYKGFDSLEVYQVAEKYLTALDGCLPIQRGELNRLSIDNSSWYEYNGEKYSVELWVSSYSKRYPTSFKIEVSVRKRGLLD
jgi:hypothetical protein